MCCVAVGDGMYKGSMVQRGGGKGICCVGVGMGCTRAVQCSGVV